VVTIQPGVYWLWFTGTLTSNVAVDIAGDWTSVLIDKSTGINVAPTNIVEATTVSMEAGKSYELNRLVKVENATGTMFAWVWSTSTDATLTMSNLALTVTQELAVL